MGFRISFQYLDLEWYVLLQQNIIPTMCLKIRNMTGRLRWDWSVNCWEFVKFIYFSDCVTMHYNGVILWSTIPYILIVRLNIELLHKFMKFMFCRKIVHFNKLLLFLMLVLCFVAIFKTIMIEMKKKTLVLIRFFLWTERKQTTTSGGSCLTPTPAASITTTPPVRKPSGTARKTVISSPLPSYR